VLIQQPKEEDRVLYKIDKHKKDLTKELSMLKSQKPTEQEKSKEFYKSHKKVFSYIEDLKNNASRPISTNLKK
jgi:hypothetical protein